MILTHRTLHSIHCCRLESPAAAIFQLSIQYNRFSALACLRGQICSRQLGLLDSPMKTSFLPKPYLVHQVFSIHERNLLAIPALRGLSSLDDGGSISMTKPTRRRRAGPHSNRVSERDRNEGVERSMPKVSPKDFASCSMNLLDKLNQRCLPLTKINDNMKVVKGDSCIDKTAKALGIESNDSLIDGPYLLVDVGPVDGRYVLIVDMERRLVLFQSPISGHLLYEYHSPTETWMNIQDGHNLEGIFVRDLCRKIKGYPNL